MRTPSVPESTTEAEDRHSKFYDARVNLGLPPAALYDRITHDPPPVVGCYNPELVHLVRHTSSR